MPLKRWKYPCCDGVRGALYTTPTCDRCGATGEYAGWAWTMHEAMARYQTWFGFKPIGPHRRFADELFASRTSPCDACDGSGLEDVDRGRTYRLCGACGGEGRRFEGDAAEFERLRQEVLARYPTSGALGVAPGARRLAFDVGAQEIVDLDEEHEARGGFVS